MKVSIDLLNFNVDVRPLTAAACSESYAFEGRADWSVCFTQGLIAAAAVLLRWEDLGVKDGTDVGIVPPGVVVIVGVVPLVSDAPALAVGALLPVVGAVPPVPPVMLGVVGVVAMLLVTQRNALIIAMLRSATLSKFSLYFCATWDHNL